MSNEVESKCSGCTPHCMYFPTDPDVISWQYGEDGLKYRRDKKEFRCAYDGHLIVNWIDKCPKLEEKENG